MWTSNRKQDGRTQEAPGDVGVVTLGGDPAGVYLSGERRWVAVYAPGGYQWRPAVGEKVLVLKAGDHQESPCLVGVRQEGTANYYYLTLRESNRKLMELGYRLEEFMY